MAKPKDIELLLNKDILEKLAKFQAIELEDVDIELEEIEFSVEGGGGISSPLLARMGFEFALIRDSANRITSLLGGPASPMGMNVPQMMPAAPVLAPAAAPQQQMTYQQQMPATFTMPTMELPAGAVPGLPSGMKVRIILKNAKIKAEKAIIKVDKE